MYVEVIYIFTLYTIISFINLLIRNQLPTYKNKVVLGKIFGSINVKVIGTLKKINYDKCERALQVHKEN